MKVKAIRIGLYGVLRNVGEEFDIDKKEDLGSWMKVVEVSPKTKAKTKAKEETAETEKGEGAQ